MMFLLLPFGGGGSSHAGDDPWEKSPWEELRSAPPVWAAQHERGGALVSFVDGGSALALPQAYSFESARVRLMVEMQLRRRLARVLGAESCSVLLDKLPAPAFGLRAMYADYSRTAGEVPVGPVTYSAWVRWDLSEADILQFLPERARPKARDALRRFEPLDAPAWIASTSQPDWVGAAPSATESITLVLATESNRRELALAIADSQALPRLVDAVSDRLKGVADAARLPGLIRATVVNVSVLDRTFVSTQSTTSAWIRWSLPVSTIMGSIPEDLRATVERELRKLR